VTVSHRDREHFRKLGELKQRSHADATSEHLALTLGERLARSWALSELYLDPNAEPSDDALAFYARARALGLYRA
jgi:hypothetical protein